MMQEIIHFINSHPILSIIWIILFITFSTLSIKNILSKTQNITCNQAIQLINKEEAITIDLRSSNDFRKGHIINSINLTSTDISNNKIGELEKHKQKYIILISSNGIEAYKSAEKLFHSGFKHVCILKEGIIGWSKENLPLVISKK